MFSANSNPVSFSDAVQNLARDAGFDAAGIAPVPEPGSAEEYAELQHLEEWIDAGRAGEMEYMKRRDEQGRLLRSSLRVTLPWARSVIVCAMNYNPNIPHSSEPAPPGTGWMARYALSAEQGADGSSVPTDYHNTLLKKLQQMAAQLQQQFGAFDARCYVDTGPLVERVYAKYAGIGWVGKNTCILNQKLGSWMFLAVIVTSLELPQEFSFELAADRCGSCQRCMEACPTQAIVAPRELDASRCIAYLTIEKKGSIPEELREGIGRHVFGCDICQEVCPWNRRAPIGRSPEMQPRQELVNPALEWLAGLQNADFKRLFKDSPIERTRLKGLRRNVANAMGNSGEQRFLPQLEAWSSGEDAVLAEAALWAMRRIEHLHATSAAKSSETDGTPPAS
ncbi:MAG: tRNA epoxyqueuosine(34) reductase QueG [Acidobacteriaceae bacterium]